jgi:predicted permease
VIPDRLPFARRLRHFAWHVPIEREVAEELAAHLELQTRRYMETGMSEADARAAAQRRFGDYEQIYEDCHAIRADMERAMTRADFQRDVRGDVAFALRTLRRSPLFAAAATITIALAVGASTAIFSLVHAVLIRGLPYANVDRAEMIWNSNGGNKLSVAPPEYFDLRVNLRAHDAVAALYRQASAFVTPGAEPEQLMAYVVTPNLFDLLGIAPAIGRGFGGNDGAQAATRVVILSHDLWTRRFGGDRSAIGKVVSVGGLPRTIIGVMPPGVRFPDAPIGALREPADMWIPSTLDDARGDGRGNEYLSIVARRARGVSDASAIADVDAVAQQWRVAYPSRYATESAKHWTLLTTPVRDAMVGSVRRGLLVVSAAVGLVLLIACANVTNLLLARGSTRQREFAIRLALGASRGRLVRQLLTESVVLAVAGGAAGVLLASLGGRALLGLGNGQLPLAADTRIDVPVLLFSLAISILAGVLAGLAPAFQFSSGTVGAGLSETSRGSSAGRRHHRIRVTLVGSQIAMALIVLVGAGLLIRSFVALQRVKLGFDPDSVLAMQLSLPRVKYDSSSKLVLFYSQLQARAAVMPGVAEAGAGYPIPMGPDGWSGSFWVEGEPSGPNVQMPHAEYGVSTPGFFHALRIPLIAGRDFSATDTPDRQSVVIVDERLANAHWPHQSAIGKRLNPNRNEGEWATVIGVVGHVHKAGPREDGEEQIYLPFAQNPQQTLALVVRGKAGPGSVASALRTAVHSLDASLPIARMQSVESFVAVGSAKERFNAALLTAFGFIALVLAAVGLYGVMAFLVTLRTREIGIRMALGGAPSAIRAMILREGLAIALGGLALGAAVSVVASRAMAGLLFGTSPTDALTYGTIVAVLIVIGIVATYVPARRATHVDPVVTLHD